MYKDIVVRCTSIITGATHVVGGLCSCECQQKHEGIFTKEGGCSKEQENEIVCTMIEGRACRNLVKKSVNVAQEA